MLPHGNVTVDSWRMVTSLQVIHYVEPYSFQQQFIRKTVAEQSWKKHNVETQDERWKMHQVWKGYDSFSLFSQVQSTWKIGRDYLVQCVRTITLWLLQSLLFAITGIFEMLGNLFSMWGLGSIAILIPSILKCFEPKNSRLNESWVSFYPELIKLTMPVAEIRGVT